jgi:hypothetical protein
LQYPSKKERVYGSEICEYPEQPVNQCKKDRKCSATGMPFERYCANPLHRHDCNRGSEQEGKKGKDPEIHDQGFSKDREIGNILEHNLHLDSDSSLHTRVDRAGIIIGARLIETLAESRLTWNKEIG